MKFLLGVLGILVFIGCTNVTVPKYIQDKNPYKHVFYAPYEDVHAQAVKSVEAQGWKIQEESDPALFERSRVSADGKRAQTVIFTEMREMSFFLGSRYSRLNVFLYVKPDKSTEVEIRMVQVTSLPFKNFDDYSSETADRIFEHMEQGLNL